MLDSVFLHYENLYSSSVSGFSSVDFMARDDKSCLENHLFKLNFYSPSIVYYLLVYVLIIISLFLLWMCVCVSVCRFV